MPRYATDLGKANAALSMSGESVQLVGWGLGGFLLASLGFYPSIIVVLILFVLSTALMLTLPLVEKEALAPETSVETLTKGWRLVVKEPKLRLIIQVNLLEILANTIWVSSVLLVFVTEVLEKTESYWGYANTAYSLGIPAGGYLVYRRSERLLQYKWQSISSSLVATALVTVLILLWPNAVAFLILSVIIGFLSQIKEVPESVFLQETVEEGNLVKVYSVIEVVSTLAFSASVFLMSWMVDYFGVRGGFWLAVACLISGAVLIFKQKDRLD